MKALRQSLTARIIALSIIWIAMALLLTAGILRILYRQHIEQHYDAHVFSHVEELVAAVNWSPDGRPVLSRQPTDPRFHRLDSGWYWEVLLSGQALQSSPSLGDKTLDLGSLNLHESFGVQSLLGPNQQQLRVHTLEMNNPHNGDSLLIVATSPEMQISDDVEEFSVHIILSFLVLGILLSLAVVFQVIVALQPLKAIKVAIGDVQAGRIKRLPQQFPSDVQPLVDELNHLLDHDERLVKRARNQLGDLAHAVKNPLTVIRNEARNMPNEQGQLILDQSHIMASSIDHYLSLARSVGKNPLGLRVPVRTVIEDLRYVVEHVYATRGINIRLSGLEDCWFRGEPQDLEEMAGNLLDNACKWATSRVEVRGLMNLDRLHLVFEDDGPGIPTDKLGVVLERGRRLDDSTPGSGQGLGIVSDIVALYGGKLTLTRSPLGGLQASLDLPAL